MRLHPFLSTLLCACTWVSTGEIDDRRAEMDDDRDGFTAAEDCNDSDESISPNAEEIWYDGIDGDCAQDDDFDADADGYVMDEYIGFQTNGVEESGSLPSGDCNEDDPDSNPGETEVWYDGVDSDCDGLDDYDQDGDSYVEDEWVGLATLNVEGSGELAGGECDDLESSINPGAEDAWYDGVDSDCGGEDDFDVDQDGHAALGVLYEPTLYVDGSGELSHDDCNDEDAAINPSQVEVWYDGTDSDCAADDDFDADVDDYVMDEYIGSITDGVCSSLDTSTSETQITDTPCLTVSDCEDKSGLEWSCTGLEGSGELLGGDCDDTNAEANPGQIEVLSDSVDRDCDGGASTVSLTDISGFSNNIASFSWVNPYRPRFASNTDSVFLSVVMEEGTYVKSTGSSSNFYDSAVAFSLPIDELEDGITDLLEWQRVPSDSTVYRLGGGHDFVATDDAVFGATSLQWFDDESRGLLLTRYEISSASRDPALYRHDALSGQTLAPLDDLNIAQDADGGLHVLGCEAEDGLAQYAMGGLDSLEEGNFEVEETVENISLSTCDLHFDADPIGLIYGAQAATNGLCFGDGTPTSLSCVSASDCEDGSGMVWSCEGGVEEGLSSYSFNRDLSTIVFSNESNDALYLPEQLVMVDSDEGTRVVFIDPFILSLVVIEPDGEEWVIDLEGSVPVSLHAARNETLGTDEVVVTIVTESGEIVLLWGSPDVGLTTYTMAPDFVPVDAASWLDPSGEIILVTATSATEVNFGMAWR